MIALNPFYDALIEADKDNFYYMKEQYLNKSMIVQADDFLQVSALLDDGKKRLSVSDDFANVMMKHPTFERTISGFKHNVTGAFINPGQLARDADKSLYTTLYCLTIKPDPYTVLVYDRNTFYIKIFNLAHFTTSRYRTLLQALVDCDVFVHNARVSPTRKNKLESMRNILKRDFKLNEYEWGLTFNGELSSILLPCIQREAIHNIDDCYYLNKGKRIQCKIKVYNVSALAEDRRGKPYQYIQGDLMKFEVTFKHEFFIHHGYATVQNFTSQHDIFNLLLADILKQFNQYLFNKLTSFEKKSLYLATGTTNQGDFMKKLTNPQSLQTKLDPELITLKNQLENLAFLFNENTKALHQNTAAINANTNALTASNDAKFLSDSIQFINKQDAGIDKRKLRIVK